jgi:hypothetical protein
LDTKKLPTLEDLRTINMSSFMSELEQSGVIHIDKKTGHISTLPPAEFYRRKRKALKSQAKATTDNQ